MAAAADEPVRRRRGERSSTTCASRTTRRRRPRRATRGALRQRAGRPAPAGRGAARPRRADCTRHRAPAPARRRRRRRARGRCRAGQRQAATARPSTGRSGRIDVAPRAHMMSNAAAGRRQAHRRRPSAWWSSARRPATSPRSCSPSRRSSARASGARGVSFAGTSLVVAARPRRRLRVVGHRAPAATSSTPSSNGSATPPAATATVQSDGLPRRQRGAGRWTARCTSETALPERGRPGAADRPTRSWSCAPGTASCRLRDDGAAASRSRSCSSAATYGRELDSALGLRAARQPRLREGRRRASATPRRPIDYTFNWFYVDDRDIAYYSSGGCRCGRDGVDGHLPRWGDADVRLAGLAAVGDAPAAGQPAVGLPGVLEQQAGARLHRGRRPVGLRRRCTAARRSPTGSRRSPRRAAVTTTDVVGATSRTPPRVDSRAFYTLPLAARRDRRRPGARRRRAPLLRGWQQRGAPRAGPGPRTALRGQAGDRAVRRVVGGRDEQERARRTCCAARLGDLVARAAAASGRPPAPGSGLVLERRRLVRLRAQGPRARCAGTTRRRLVRGLLRRRATRDLPDRPAGLAEGRGGAGCSPQQGVLVGRRS